MGSKKRVGIRRAVTAAVASGGIAAVALAGAPGLAGASSAPTSTAAASTGVTPSGAMPSAAAVASPWAAVAQGRPTFEAGSESGFYIWHDGAGWHLEVTHPTHDHVVFSGYLTSDGTVRVNRVDDERNDVVRVGPARHVAGFAFNNYGYVDGLHFRTDDATRLVFHLSVNGRPVPATSVDLGRHDANPLRVPFTVARTGA